MRRLRRLCVSLVLAVALCPSAAHATSQWSRKYGVACTTCHTAAFPRLNYYGEKFMRNGYQDVGTQDGDTAGKQAVGDRLFLEEIGNLLGVRLNVVPVRLRTNALESRPGKYRTRLDVGNTDWMQLFVAGSVFKNASIFIETEFSASGEVHFSWFRFGFHNLLGGPGLNVWIGLMDPLELHAASGRLPMIPPARHEVFYVGSSGNRGDDSVSLRAGRPALALYGSFGPVVYEVGVDNGKSLTDPNRDKNFWGTLRLEATGGPVEGSAISGWGYVGRDSKRVVTAQGMFVDVVRSRFWRVSPAANLRRRDLDVIGAWVYGHDENWALAPGGPEATFHGLFAQVGHPLGKRFYLAGQFDRVFSDEAPELELQKVGLAASFQPRENLRLILFGQLDALPTGTAHPRRQHDALLMIRTMF